MNQTKPAVAMIMYYDWYSDGRGKTIRDVYTSLGYEILVFCTRESGYEKYREEGNVRVWNGNAKYMGDRLGAYLLHHVVFMILAGFWLLRRCIRQRPAVIHIHNMPDYLSALALIGRCFGIRSIWDVRDISAAVWFTKKNPTSLTPDGIFFDILVMIQRLSAKCCDGVICADENQREFLIRHGARPQTTRVVMNLPLKGVFNWIGPTIDKEVPRIVYHGTMTQRLGIDLVVYAIHLLAKNRRHFLCDIIGDGDAKEEIRRLVRELGLDERVRIQGRFIETEKIPEWVRGASFAVISNRRTHATDNFMLPHKMLEYIRLGIPVIVPRLGIISRYMKEDEVVFYEPDNVKAIAGAILSMQKTDLNCIARRALRFYQRNSYQKNEANLKVLIGMSRTGRHIRSSKRPD